MIQDPSVFARSALDAFQTSFALAAQVSQNPSAFMDWAFKSVSSAINVVLSSANQSEASRKAFCS